jgi:hypothetical protein
MIASRHVGKAGDRLSRPRCLPVVSLTVPAATTAPPDLLAERTARLVFDAELASGAADLAAVTAPAVLDAIRPGPVPPLPRRLLQDVDRKLGRLDYERDVEGPLVAIRAATLGERSGAPPRFLVRVDEFPHYRAWDEPGQFGGDAFRRFHEILTSAGVPYLVAVLPRVSRAPLAPDGDASRPLDDGEVALLHELADDGVAFATHGRDHRTRFASPRRHSELSGLDAASTEALLDDAQATLDGYGIQPDVFVPPYNRFDAAQLSLLTERFQIVCGGPESIRMIGLHSTPQWRGDGVYLPAYFPFYARAREVLDAAEQAIDRATGLWTPIALHWGWEAETGWSDLERLAERLAPHATSWDEFGAAVERSR